VHVENAGFSRRFRHALNLFALPDLFSIMPSPIRGPGHY
jgi:hypothetical protein